jgi:hypothetical protein
MMNQELFNILDQFGDPNLIQKSLGEFLETQVRLELQKAISQAGFQGTGRLRSSVVVTYDENAQTISIGMQDYGIYQNYGVLGYNGYDRGVDDVESFWGIVPSSGSKFKYGKGPAGWRGMRKYGLRAKKFIPTEADIRTLVEHFIEQYNTINDQSNEPNSETI